MTQLTKGPPRQREQPYRKLAYRKHVANLPCLRCLHKGNVQAAHIRAGNEGGMGLKPHDWFCIPLCSIRGCGAHAAFDANQENYALVWLGPSIDELKAEAKAAWETWKETQ